MRSPQPPIPLPDQIRAAPAIRASRVAVPSELIGAWRADGLDVAVDTVTTAESARDWWPRSLGWTVESGALSSHRPGAVVRPRDAGDVARVLTDCSTTRVPVTAAGGRSGVCGASLPVHGGVVLDMTSMQGVVSVDATSGLVRVLPGTFGDDLEDHLRATYSLTVGHWPQSMALATVGGWVACRGAGQYSTRYGKVEDLVAGLEVVLADGTVVTTGGRAPREASGPDLTQLVLGSEGTLGIVTEVTLRARPVPAHEARWACTFASFADGLEACRRILRRGATPAVLRLYDERESVRQRGLAGPDGRHALLVLDEGDPVIVEATMTVVRAECLGLGAQSCDIAAVDRWMSHRNDVSGLQSAVTAGWIVDTVEVAASWTALPAVHREVTAAIASVEGTKVVSCHQSHAYADGACLYFTIAGRSAEPDAWYRAAWDAAMAATMACGGAVSHHHGIGLLRGRHLRASLGPGFAVLEALKAALDPAGVLNPGKLGLASPFGEVVVP